MPNHVKNKIEFICDRDLMKNIFLKYNTHFPATLYRAHDNTIVCRKNGEDFSVGWFNDKTGVFNTREENTEQVGLPEGWEFEVKQAIDHFPDFNKVIPQPDNIFNGDLGREEEEMCRRDGRPTWYDWNRSNWGTKWNSYECEKLDDNIFIFETAWSRVECIIGKISQDFPDAKIIYTYADEDTGYNCGRLIFEKGQLQSSYIPADNTKEAYDIAFELRPHYKDDYMLDGDNYKSKDDEEQ